MPIYILGEIHNYVSELLYSWTEECHDTCRESIHSIPSVVFKLHVELAKYVSAICYSCQLHCVNTVQWYAYMLMFLTVYLCVCMCNTISLKPLLSRARVTCEEYGSYPEHVYTWEGYSNRSVSYPEHVYT